MGGGTGMPFIQRSYKKKIWKRGIKLILGKWGNEWLYNDSIWHIVDIQICK